MVKSFETFVSAWKKLVESEAVEINEATLFFFLAKNFGTSKNNVPHYRELSLKLGFISANKDGSFSIHKKAIKKAFDSK